LKLYPKTKSTHHRITIDIYINKHFNTNAFESSFGNTNWIDVISMSSKVAQMMEQRVEISNLANHIKQLIIDQSIVSLHDYHPVKVQARSETRYTITDTKQFLMDKKKRLQNVHQCGFLSDPKETYKPLYDPQVDTELLLYKSLQLNISKGSHTTVESEGHREQQQQKKQHQKIRMKMRQVPKRTTNGFKLIKQKIQDSNERIMGVKFGINFEDVCREDTREHTYDENNHFQQEQTIQWDRLEIDEERKSYFLNIYNKFVDQKPQLVKVVKVQPKKKKEVQKKYSSKQIEQNLGIVRQSHTNTDKFFTTRDDFYEQRSRLHFQLSEELSRLDHERKSTIQRKLKVFELSLVLLLDVEG
jgi:hypothetical protein